MGMGVAMPAPGVAVAGRVGYVAASSNPVNPLFAGSELTPMFRQRATERARKVTDEALWRTAFQMLVPYTVTSRLLPSL